MIRWQYAAALAAVTLAGCLSSSEQSQHQKDTVSERIRQYEGQFVPSAEDQPAADTSRLPSPGTDRPGTRTDIHSPAITTPVEVPGFRIQIFSTNDFDEAEKQKAEAEAIFAGEWIYVQYDQPTYKIRVGNFLTKLDAERFRGLAVEKGFAGAGIVPDKVFKNPPPPKPK